MTAEMPEMVSHIPEWVWIALGSMGYIIGILVAIYLWVRHNKGKFEYEFDSVGPGAMCLVWPLALVIILVSFIVAIPIMLARKHYEDHNK
jgi:uncharacterized membrane protein